MKIWANILTRNEERYLWFSVLSVIDHVDKVMIWDDGSIDDSPRIIKEIKKMFPEKTLIKFIKKGSSPTGYPRLRQKMLEESKCDWVILVDADEVWWKSSIERLVEMIQAKGDTLDCFVSSYKNIIGDIYHYQSESAGMYQIGEQKGHLTIRAMNRKIPGLRFDRPHGQLCLIDQDGRLIQDRSEEKRMDAGIGYLHFTNMIRSRNQNLDTKTPKRSFKYKYEMGNSLPLDFYYPEVFFASKPDWIISPWEKMSTNYKVRAMLQTPIKRLKRNLIKPKVGY